MTPIDWIVLGICALPVLAALFLLSLLRKLRRAGRPDRAGEIVIGLWLLAALVHLFPPIVFPATPRWVWLIAAAPATVLGFGLLAVRVRRHPEVLFSPAAIARARRLAGRVRR